MRDAAAPGAGAVSGVEWASRLRRLGHDAARKTLQTKLGDATADAMRGTWNPGDAQLPGDREESGMRSRPPFVSISNAAVSGDGRRRSER